MALAKNPSVFGEIRQPTEKYLLIPKVSSSERHYIPIGFVDENIIASGSALVVPNATEYHFGVLQSAMHMAWVRAVGGRMKSDYQYSVGIIYNNFPWPQKASAKAVREVGESARALMEARDTYPDATLADLYDPIGMPTELLKAHHRLDRAVDRAYGRTALKTEPERVAYLFKIYQEVTTQGQQEIEE